MIKYQINVPKLFCQLRRAVRAVKTIQPGKYLKFDSTMYWGTFVLVRKNNILIVIDLLNNLSVGEVLIREKEGNEYIHFSWLDTVITPDMCCPYSASINDEYNDYDPEEE